MELNILHVHFKFFKQQIELNPQMKFILQFNNIAVLHVCKYKIVPNGEIQSEHLENFRKFTF